MEGVGDLIRHRGMEMSVIWTALKTKVKEQGVTTVFRYNTTVIYFTNKMHAATTVL